MSYTYAILDVSTHAYREIRRRLVEAGHEQAFGEDGGRQVIHLYGLALREELAEKPADAPDFDVVDRGEFSALAKQLDTLLMKRDGTRLGFGLVVFDFGEGGNLQWISNADRTDMIAALRELLGKWARDGSVPN